MFLLPVFSVIALASAGTRSKHRWSTSEGESYALLVSGASGWHTYGMQADVCHAYHSLKNHGIPEQNIIVMMYDDIADADVNPFPGKLFNKPFGRDVYEGVKIDYKGNSVTPQNFLNILKGNASGVVGGNGRVLKSNRKDHIFVLISDHGETGVIQFPGEMLTAKSLNEALEWMHKNDRYDQLVFYLDTCYSGSMFEKILKENINVYAVTSANSGEPSLSTYCDVDERLPCIGGLFTVSWLEHFDEGDTTAETLEDQYKIVKQLTNRSHVMHYGDLHIASEPVGWFQGDQILDFEKIVYEEKYRTDRMVSWPSGDVELMYLNKLKDSTSDALKAKKLSWQIQKLHEDQRNIESIFLSLVDNLLHDPEKRRLMVKERNAVKNLDCHHEVVHAFDLICVNFNKHDCALKHIYMLNNLCIEFGQADKIIAAMWSVCSNEALQYL